jgi:DNA modification methylase
MPQKISAKKARGAKKARRRSRKKAATKKSRATASPKGATDAEQAPLPTIPSSDLAITVRAVSALKPSRNARTHTAAQVRLIADAIIEFGWMNPLIIDDKGRILAGHGRWQAAKLLGVAGVPVIPVSHLTVRQKRAYILADNRLAELAGWDPQILAAELGALGKMGFELGVIGWDPDEVREVIATAGATLRGKTGPDDIPETPETPVSLTGDLWALGQHRILCGDSTKPSDVASLLEGRRAPLLMVTDPPYGVSYDPKWRERSGLARPGTLATGAVTNDDRADWREAWELFPGDVLYVWHAGTKAHVVSASLEAAGFVIRSQIVWIKSRFAISRGNYHVQHEPAFYATRKGLEDDHWQELPEGESQPDSAEGLDPFDRFAQDQNVALYAVRKGAVGHYRGGRKQSTVWNIEHVKNDTGHATQKPVEAMRRPMENNSAAGDAVYEPFCGSGTSIVAAEMGGRICYALELEARYVDLSVLRWQAFTGKTAVLEASGQSWAEVMEERGGG